MGSGCGSVGRVVASDARDLGFESSHRQNFIQNMFYCQLLKRQKEQKRPGMVHVLKTITTQLIYRYCLRPMAADQQSESYYCQRCLELTNQSVKMKVNFFNSGVKGVNKCIIILFFYTMIPSIYKLINSQYLT